MARIDGRENNQLRKIKITRNYTIHAEGSVLIEFGNTKVICNASIEDNIPRFKRGTKEGWLTAEYSMLPRATNIRNHRDINKLKHNQRSVEIQRLISRSLRSAVDFKKLGERTIIIDCDVIQADGGTRTASITGAFIALHDANTFLIKQGLIKQSFVKNFVSAISVGIVDNIPMLDLLYKEDVNALTDMNVVMNESGCFIEIQGTAEGHAFTKKQLDELIELAEIGNKQLITFQKEALNLI